MFHSAVHGEHLISWNSAHVSFVLSEILCVEIKT